MTEGMNQAGNPTGLSYEDLFKEYRSSQKKYDYFFLGVILASLSLSVQIIELPTCGFIRHATVMTWGLFLVSFLSGMFRQERLLRFYRVEADNLKFHRRKEAFEQGLAGGINLMKMPNNVWTEAEMTAEVSNAEVAIEIAKKYLGKDQRATSIAYAIQKWAFVGAMIGVVVVKYYAG